jgi:hypothetical protein
LPLLKITCLPEGAAGFTGFGYSVLFINEFINKGKSNNNL